MPDITFYLLTSNSSSVEQIACRLAAKAWRGGHAVHIYTPNKDTTQQLDQLLWCWQEDSFIPHSIMLNHEAEQKTPVTISHEPPGRQQDRILINLTPEAIGNTKDYQRICEIVTQDPDGKALSREKFRRYRQASIQPKTYQL